MKVHMYKDISAIIYQGEEEIVCRDLKQKIAPTVSKGDVLIVPTKNAKFMSRAGTNFEMVDLEELLNQKPKATSKAKKTTATKDAN